MRTAAIAAAALAAAFALAPIAPSAAQPGLDGVDRLTAASSAADAGDWPGVDRLARPVAADPHARRGDRAEAFRLLGLAAYHAQRTDDAEAFFLSYLQLDLDGRLDPSLYAPELVAFFENVRATHAAELRALRPRPRRAIALNLMPPAGQFQNHQVGKGWTLAIVGGALLATNIGTYAMLERWCDRMDDTCESGSGASRAGTARTLKRVNLASGAALIGLYVYGVYDGFRHYRRTRGTVVVTPVLSSDGAGLSVGAAF